MSEKPLYSTDAKTTTNKRGKSPKAKSSPFKSDDSGPKYRLEKKGRGGKTVTVVWNLAMDSAELKKVVKDLKALAGCGGSLHSSHFELQGDRSKIIEKYFADNGKTIKRSGG